MKTLADEKLESLGKIINDIIQREQLEKLKIDIADYNYLSPIYRSWYGMPHNSTMNHIDLFSGIGGFAHAARQVWPDYRNLFFCDNNTFCQAVIRKNFGADSLIYDDIREVTVERFITDTKHLRKLQSEGGEQNKRGWIGNCDLLTGGFPCQPFSVAGKQKGRDDDRHLWPEMFRVISAFSPRWVIAENVRGLINIENGMAFEQVCLDLESAEYTVQAFIIPACAKNAPHRRDRVWIVANAKISNANGAGNKSNNQWPGSTRIGGRLRDEPCSTDRHATDTASRRGQEIRQDIQPKQSNGVKFNADSWGESWLEVATRLCRVDDGLPAGVDGLELSKSKHREERLKALGNAIVPQVVMEIMKAIQGDQHERMCSV